MPRRSYEELGFQARRIKVVLSDRIWAKVDLLARSGWGSVQGMVEGQLLDLVQHLSTEISILMDCEPKAQATDEAAIEHPLLQLVVPDTGRQPT